jgi:hypothetical protein
MGALGGLIFGVIVQKWGGRKCRGGCNTVPT